MLVGIVFALCVLIGLAFDIINGGGGSQPMTSGSGSQSSCEQNRGSSCYSAQKSLPDSARGGISAGEYCAAQAILSCSGQ